MVEIWLIFNLFIPFAEVLLHTYMDTLRWFPFKDVVVFCAFIESCRRVAEGSKGKGDIKEKLVHSTLNKDLISRNEKVQVQV